MNLLEHFLILFDTQVRGAGIKQVNKQIAGTTKGLMSANNMLKVFFGYDLYRFVKQLIPDLINTSQQLGAMESRFNAVSTSARAGAQELGWVGEQSKRLGLNFLKTADDYSIFYATVRKNMGQETTRKVFKDWAEAFRVLHIDPERQSRVLYALREMSSKGKIYMQDLALQLGSAVPDAMNLASEAMGYTGPNAVNEFREAIKKGQVDVKKFIPLFSEMVNKTYVNSKKLADAMNLPDAQIQLLTTHWQFLQKKIYEGGFGKDLVSVLKLLNRGLGFLEEHGGEIYGLLKGIVGLMAILAGARILGGIIKFTPILIKSFKYIKSLGIINGLRQATYFITKIIGKLSGFGSIGSKVLSIFGGKGALILAGLNALLTGATIGYILGSILNWFLNKFGPTVIDWVMHIGRRIRIAFITAGWALNNIINDGPIGDFLRFFGWKGNKNNKDNKDWKDVYDEGDFDRDAYFGIGINEAINKNPYRAGPPRNPSYTTVNNISPSIVANINYNGSESDKANIESIIKRAVQESSVDVVKEAIWGSKINNNPILGSGTTVSSGI